MFINLKRMMVGSVPEADIAGTNKDQFYILMFLFPA